MNCPGNTLPIIWGDRKLGRDKPWLPLFPRYFNPWHDGSDTLQQIIDRINFNPNKTSLEKRKMLAFILTTRTRKEEDEIVEMLGLKSQNMERVFAKIDHDSQTNPDYREKLRQLFRVSS
jgi:hypothetical protein